MTNTTVKAPKGAIKPKKNNELTIIGRLQRSMVAYGLMAPFLILFCVFTILPVCFSIYLSFTYFNLMQAPSWTGLDNYIRMFLDDATFLIVLKNTLLFAIITGPLGYLMSFVTAWLINELGPKLRPWMTAVFYMPSLCGGMASMWTLFFAGDTKGYANSILLSVGIIRNPIYWLSDPSYVMTCIIIIQLWMSLGVSFLSFIAGFKNLSKDYFEAAAIDGVRNRWQELWCITLPQMAPQLVFSAVMTISSSFGSTLASQLAGSPTTQYSADTLVTYMNDVGSTRFEVGYAAAITVFMFVLMLLVNYVIRAMLSSFSTE